MSFRDQMAADLAVIFNIDEFAEMHTINGKQVKCVVDSDKLLAQAGEFNLTAGMTMIYVPVTELSFVPIPGMQLLYDGKPSQISTVNTTAGVYEILLAAMQ